MSGARGIGGFMEGFAGGALTRQSLDRQKKVDDALEKLAPAGDSTSAGDPQSKSIGPFSFISGVFGGGGKAASAEPAQITPAQITPVTTTALPEVKLSDTMASAIDAAVAANPGVDANYLRRLTTIESGGNPNARNPKSSAGGAFQFIDSTAAQYGLKNKFDPVESSNAAARLTLANRAHLTKVLGRDPTPGELYLAHQQGAGGATKILTNPDASAADLVGADAVRLNGGKVGMTAGQFADLWTKRFGATEPSRNLVYRGELRGADPASLIVAPVDRTRGIGINPKDAELLIKGSDASNARSITAAAFSS